MSTSQRHRGTTTPTEKRLRAANDNDRLNALAAYKAATDPISTFAVPDLADGALTVDKPTPGDGWRMRPGTGEIAAAIALERVAIRTAAGRRHADRARGGTVHIGPLVFTKRAYFERGPMLVAGEVASGSVRVPAGAMIERGRTAKDKPLKPTEHRTYEQSTSKAPEPDSETYLKMLPARSEGEPHRRVALVAPGGQPRALEPTPQAKAAGEILEAAWAKTDVSQVRWAFLLPASLPHMDNSLGFLICGATQPRTVLRFGKPVQSKRERLFEVTCLAS